MYKIINDPIKTDSYVIKRLEDSAYIPTDNSNADYVEYLKWVAEGNVPTPAEESGNE